MYANRRSIDFDVTLSLFSVGVLRNGHLPHKPLNRFEQWKREEKQTERRKNIQTRPEHVRSNTFHWNRQQILVQIETECVCVLFRCRVKFHRKSRNEYLSLFIFSSSRIHFIKGVNQREFEIISMTLASIIDEDDVGRWHLCVCVRLLLMIPDGTRHPFTTKNTNMNTAAVFIVQLSNKIRI